MSEPTRLLSAADDVARLPGPAERRTPGRRRAVVLAAAAGVSLLVLGAAGHWVLETAAHLLIGLLAVMVVAVAGVPMDPPAFG